jgi:hypothetical protein
MNENPAADLYAQQIADYNRQFVTNEFADDASVLGVQPLQFGFPGGFAIGLPQPAPAYRPPAGQSSMSKNLAKSRRLMKVKRRLKQGRVTLRNGRVGIE